MGYKQLAKEERYYIDQRKANNPFISGRDLAKEMNRSPPVLIENFGAILMLTLDFIQAFEPNLWPLSGRKRLILRPGKCQLAPYH